MRTEKAFDGKCTWGFSAARGLLALALLGRANLHPDALEKTVDALIEAMLDEVFGRDC